MTTTPSPDGTDYSVLDLGFPAGSMTTVSIVGLTVNVYGLKEIEGSKLPIAALIATHGRCNNQKQMATFANGVLGHARSIQGNKTKKRDLIVVTLDQRNHGERTKDRNSNLSYDKNPRHLIDMAACVVGGAQDVTFVIDLLEAYLFPSGERTIDEWIATGFSLGGNETWRLLRTEPRIRIAIPLLGLPFDALKIYLLARAVSMGLSPTPPLYPPTLRPILEAPRPKDCYAGKKILTIHGAEDRLVPYEKGAELIAEAKVEAEAGGGHLAVLLVDGVGHKLTPDMIRHVAEWVWRWALSADKDSSL